MNQPDLAERPIVLGSERGMVFFLAFLVVTIVFVPMTTLPQAGLFLLTLIFGALLITGAFATIRDRILRIVVVTLAIVIVIVGWLQESSFLGGLSTVETTLRLIGVSILLFMTLSRTLRPGPVTVDRVLGGISGYLLIGYVWTFAFQLVALHSPDAIHVGGRAVQAMSRQPSELIYFSFITLTTLGYGDAYPVNPVARSLAVAEGLVGQLYIAVLIGTLVGIASQARTERKS